MPPADDAEAQRRIDRGPGPSAGDRPFRQPLRDIDCSERRRDRLERLALPADLLDQAGEYLHFQRQRLFAGAHDALLEIVELAGGEPHDVGHRLAAIRNRTSK